MEALLLDQVFERQLLSKHVYRLGSRKPALLPPDSFACAQQVELEL